ncbi:MAG: TM2 domain-containing protein [Spirochaetaceae bacterium]|jgi:TM2 domain-containing membrane protein YozV|nr:TM2 domain-containing protein [Spirochaetaceae bacterium]
MKYCAHCGSELMDEAVICIKCGCAVEQIIEGVSEKDWLTTLLLSIFLGGIGVHRFYVNKIGTGIIMLLLCWTGISLIWAIIDIIMIATGKFNDKNGNAIIKK